MPFWSIRPSLGSFCQCSLRFRRFAQRRHLGERMRQSLKLILRVSNDPYRSCRERDYRGDLVQGLADLSLCNLDVEIILET